VFGSAHKVALTGKSGRKPDVTMYLDGQKLPRRRPSADTPPSVAIEVVTPTPRDTKRDRVEKPDEYARAGVRSYWLIDPTMRTLEVFELGADRRYVRAKSASGGRVKIPGYPGLALDLDGLWAELDSLDG
jgi:Uma2 family endonuclease